MNFNEINFWHDYSHEKKRIYWIHQHCRKFYPHHNNSICRLICINSRISSSSIRRLYINHFIVGYNWNNLCHDKHVVRIWWKQKKASAALGKWGVRGAINDKKIIFFPSIIINQLLDGWLDGASLLRIIMHLYFY